MKEDRYTEALNTAKMWYENTETSPYIKGVLREIFPELAESEDERIRKELLAVVGDLVLPDDQQSRFVTWIEKQGRKEEIKAGNWVMRKDGTTFSNGSISARVQRIEGHKIWLEHGTYVNEWELKKLTD